MKTKEYRKGFRDAKHLVEQMLRYWRKCVREDKFPPAKALRGLAYDVRHDVVVNR